MTNTQMVISRANGYIRNRDRLSSKLRDLERSERLDSLPSPIAGVTRAHWNNLSLERKRAVITYSINVEASPTTKRRFDPETIKVTWNDQDHQYALLDRGPAWPPARTLEA